MDDLIALSPHLDDAVLSVGGLLHRVTRQGGRALVATFCTRVPERAAIPPALRRFADVETRRSEDLQALGRLGAEPRWLGFVDRVLRPPPVRFRALFEPAAPGEPAARAQRARMREAIEGLLAERPAAALLCPLGVGGHQDHLQVRQAALEAAAAAGAGARLAFYEDFYALASPGEAAPRALDGLTLTPAPEPLSPEDERAELEAAACYASQLSALGGLQRLGELLARRHAALGGAAILHRVLPVG